MDHMIIKSQTQLKRLIKQYALYLFMRVGSTDNRERGQVSKKKWLSLKDRNPLQTELSKNTSE